MTGHLFVLASSGAARWIAVAIMGINVARELAFAGDDDYPL